MKSRGGKEGAGLLYFQRGDSAWGRGTPIFMGTIKFAGTHDPHEEARGRARD